MDVSGEAQAKKTPKEPPYRPLLLFFLLMSWLSFPLVFLWGMIWSQRSEEADLTLEALSKMGVMLIPFAFALTLLLLSYAFKKKERFLKTGASLVSGYLVAFLSLGLALSGFIPLANHDYSYVSALGEETGISFPKEGHIKRESAAGAKTYSSSLVRFTRSEEAEAFSQAVLQSPSWQSDSPSLTPLVLRKDFSFGNHLFYADRYFVYNRQEKTVNQAPSSSGVFPYVEIEHLQNTAYLAIYEYNLVYSSAQ
jgi:hypothetical protein